jgi:ribonuclease HI
LLASRSIRDFSIIKYFNINIHPPKAPQTKEVIWYPPSSGWIKCNTDGAASSVTSSCGGIFRNFLADMVCCFAQNTGQGFAFHAELCGAMSAIEIAHSFHWRQLWIETDSSLVVKAFKNDAIIPWKLRNRWSNCNSLLINMKVIVSHVFREGNSCADSLARIGLDLENLTIWFKLPSVVRDSFLRNKLGLPSYRLTNL